MDHDLFEVILSCNSFEGLDVDELRRLLDEPDEFRTLVRAHEDSLVEVLLIHPIDTLEEFYNVRKQRAFILELLANIED
jgi:hypothetical protein